MSTSPGPKIDEVQPQVPEDQPSECGGKPVIYVATEEERPPGQTKRSLEFTTENFKVELSNLPNRIKYHVVRNLLENHFKLAPHKIRVGNQKAFLAFRSENERDEAIQVLDRQEWKGQILQARLAEPRLDPLQKRIKPDIELSTEEMAEISGDDVNDKVCPLWAKTYEEQLKIKERTIRKVLNMTNTILKLSANLERDFIKLYQWIQKNKIICCQFDGIEPSPRLNGYRNKCEFNIGRDGVIGFRMGRYKDGLERVVNPPFNCPIINKNMFQIFETFQKFLKDKKNTKLRGYDHVTHEGNLRQLTVRTNEKDECLIIVDLHPQNISKADLEEEFKVIVELFKENKQVVSIYLNISEKNHLTDANETLRLIHGESYLIEYLAIEQENPLKFRIGPTSFFQVNTKAAEVLYKSIIDLAELNEKSLVLDVGCGTGTIGLSLARKVSYVIGIEISASAINDAEANARDNEISNVSFFAGKAEDLINESISILKTKLAEQNNEGSIIAIVDPPRVGFNNSFIKSLRASTIEKIIYVACDPKANSNLISLCRPTSKAYPQDPFVPTRAKAFDLFPHTNLCELVLVYERLYMVDKLSLG